jgi:hypothetical protein
MNRGQPFLAAKFLINYDLYSPKNTLKVPTKKLSSKSVNERGDVWQNEFESDKLAANLPRSRKNIKFHIDSDAKSENYFKNKSKGIK